MSRDMNQTCLTFVAAADLRTLQYTFVKLDTAGKVVACSAAGEHAIGVLQNKPNTGEAATVCVFGGTKIKASATIAAGVTIATTAAGLAKDANEGVVNTSDAGAASDPVIGSFHLGTLLVAAVNGDIAQMLFNPMGSAPTTAS